MCLLHIIYLLRKLLNSNYGLKNEALSANACLAIASKEQNKNPAEDKFRNIEQIVQT